MRYIELLSKFVVGDLQTAGAIVDLLKLEKDEAAFWEDPMTAYCGCTRDFAEDFDRKRRHLICNLLSLADANGYEEIKRFCFDALEEWMP